jgi:hypothetical protein
MYFQVSVEDYTKNLQTFISYINKTWPQAGIVFLSPSLTDFDSMKKFQDTMQIPEQFRNPRSDEHTKKYVEAEKTVADKRLSQAEQSLLICYRMESTIPPWRIP